MDENDVSIRIGKEDIIYYATFVHDEINFLFLLRQVKLEKLEKDNLKLKKFLVTNREKTKKTLQLIKVAIKYSNFEGEFLVFVTGKPYRAFKRHRKGDVVEAFATVAEEQPVTTQFKFIY